jgi:hypothetical protein
MSVSKVLIAFGSPLITPAVMAGSTMPLPSIAATSCALRVASSIALRLTTQYAPAVMAEAASRAASTN